MKSSLRQKHGTDLKTLPDQTGEAKQVPSPSEKVPLPDREKQVLGVASCDGQFGKSSTGKGKPPEFSQLRE